MIFPRVKSILRSNGYRLHTRPYELNIVGVRTRSTKPNRFDDEVHVFYKSKPLKWEYHIFKATTDPGTYWLENPMQPQGTAILAQGQYVNAYRIGLHQGKYKALVQAAPVTVIRDYDRNAKLDFFNGRKDKGLFGINIHRALAQGKTKFIDKFSAGCQVFQDAVDFDRFMGLCDKHSSLYGNRFTYTLLDFRAMRRESIKRMVVGTLTLGLGLIGYINYDTNEETA
ncbi:MAG: hypothetical protein IT233_10565 [Bacteroidia bacterium]|nr:hypothetical protein [Bacteroidia bacterium]